jgi:hypothetical protein
METAIGELRSGQNPAGSFSDASGAPSVVHTALILSILSDCAQVEVVEDIRRRAAEFLLAQKNGDWEFQEDTSVAFYALSALAQYDPQIIDGAGIAKILRTLISLESGEGGPYYLKNRAGEVDRVIDPVTNAAVARFLKKLEVELPNLQRFRGLLDEPAEVIGAFCLGSTPALSAAQSLAENCRERAQTSTEAVSSSSDQFDAGEQEMMDRILVLAEKKFSGMDPELRTFALERLRKTISGNGDKQMSLMAYYTKQALGRAGEKLSDGLVAEMGLMNIFFWTAFIVYDDFWDEDEEADPRLLPVANMYARYYTDYFSAFFPEEQDFRAFFHQLMDGLDGANTWETVHCRTRVEGARFFATARLPDYGDYGAKYRPASGHILGPVALLVTLGYGLDSPEVQQFIAYFRHYLIAMQLNDDAHDWEEDMRRGHLSTAVTMLLEDLGPERTQFDLDAEADLLELKEMFWFKTLPRVAALAVEHTQLSRQALQSISLFENLAPLERFIALNEAVSKKAMREQKDSVDFLGAYQD